MPCVRRATTNPYTAPGNPDPARRPMRDEQLYAYVADARARAAAGARRRTRWLTQQLREDATFDAICTELATAQATVEIALPAGRRRRGRLTGCGDGVLAL